MYYLLCFVLKYYLIFIDQINVKTSLFYGEIVKVFSLEKHGFLRAKIIDKNKNGNTYNVNFIDIGEKGTFEFNDIYKISDKCLAKEVIVYL